MAQLKDLLVAGPGRVLNDLYVQSSIYVTNGIKIGSAYELKSFGTGLSLSSAGVLSASNNGTVTQIVAGTGLTGGTITTSGTIAVNFGGTGSATTVARSDHTHSYLPLSGGTMTGTLTAKANVYDDTYTGALNMANSNIYGVNAIYFADSSDSQAEGINFYRSATATDTIYAYNGKLYFVPNRTLGQNGTAYEVLTTLNYISNFQTNNPLYFDINNKLSLKLRDGAPLQIEAEDGSLTVITGTVAGTVATGNHTHTNMVTGSGLTSGYFVVGNNNSAVKISSMYPSTSSTTWSTSSDVYVPTMKAISSYVTGLGYTTNTGTVTSVTLTQGTGITVSNSGTAITSSGTRTISVTSANVSTMMNLLSEGSSNATRNDYAIVQYAGGGTTTTTYHRRKLANVFAALNSSDITTALGFTPTSNTGTVTSVTIAAGPGIIVDNAAAITTSGTRTISADAGKGIIVDNNGINILCDAPLYIDDDDDFKLKIATGSTSTTVSRGDHTHSTYVTKPSSTDNAIVRFDGANGAIQNSGIIIEDNDDLKIGRYTYNVVHAHTTSTAYETVIHTKIIYASSAYMPIIRIYGYAYGLQSPIELKLGFYIYQGNMGYCGAVSMGAWRPEVYIFKETVNSVDYVAIGLKGQCYFLGFDVDVQFPTSTYTTSYISTTGWSVTFNTSSSSSVIPATGTASVCVQVPYKSTLATLTVQGTAYDGTAAKTINIQTLIAAGASAVTTDPGTGKLGYYYSIGKDTPGLFPATDAANAILTIHRYSNTSSNYCSQLGFSNGAMYFRTYGNSALDTTKAWDKVITSGTIANTLKMTNGSLDINYSDGLSNTGTDGALIVNFAGSGSATTVARSDHTHGYITNIGALGSNASVSSVATGDALVIMDASDSSKISYLGATLNTTHGGSFLRRDGTWAVPPATSGVTAIRQNNGSGTEYTNVKLTFSGATINMSNNIVLVTIDGTCLMEGTKILMADRTEKNVEDVVEGDLIMSYDPNTGEMCEAIVIANLGTGVSDDFVNYYFDDGSFVTIFGKHCLYNSDMGTARGVDFWEPGWKCINSSGEEITYIGSEDITHVGRKRHFDLRSSNMLYFANGVLNANALTANNMLVKRSGFEFPQSYLDAIQEDADSSARLNTFKFDKTIGSRLVPILKEMREQKKILDDNKKLLADTDYIVAKFTEGLISTVEWLKAKADRAGWRTLVNKAEEAYNTAKTRYDAFKDQYKPTSTHRERFNAAVARDNACLEALKTYYANRK